MATKITIRDVAKRAKTSTAAVSYVLNGKAGMVGTIKAKRIEKAAKDLGYRPARWAKQLRSNKSKTIAVQIASPTTVSNSSRPTTVLNLIILQGISEYASRLGYHVHLVIPDFCDDIVAIEKQVISENGIDGIVFLGYPNRHDIVGLDKVLKKMRQLNIPAVTMDQKLAGMGLPAVFGNLEPAVNSAINRISKLGCKTAGYIGSNSRVSHEIVSRFQLFKESLNSNNIALPDKYIYHTKNEIGGYQGVLELLKPSSGLNDLPDCLIFGADHIAMAGLEALKDNGIKVPEDIRVLSVDNAPYAQEALVELASIDQQYFNRGQTLAKLLLDQITNTKGEIPSRTVIDAIFVDGDSLSGNITNKNNGRTNNDKANSGGTGVPPVKASQAGRSGFNLAKTASPEYTKFQSDLSNDKNNTTNLLLPDGGFHRQK